MLNYIILIVLWITMLSIFGHIEDSFLITMGYLILCFVIIIIWYLLKDIPTTKYISK